MRSAALVFLFVVIPVSVAAQDAEHSKPFIKCTETTCDHIYVNGYLFVVARGADVNVVAGGIKDTGHHIFLTVAVKDRSNSGSIDVIPSLFTLSADLDQKMKSLSYIDPAKATHSEGGASKWANVLDGFAAGTATQKTTVQTTGNASYIDHSSDGTMTNGTIAANSTSTIRTPDYAARDAARQRIAQRDAATALKQGQLSDAALRATTITPGAAASGIVFFEHEKKAETFTLTVPVNGTAYIFEFKLKR
jgi:hypothetical protein